MLLLLDATMNPSFLLLHNEMERVEYKRLCFQRGLGQLNYIDSLEILLHI